MNRTALSAAAGAILAAWVVHPAAGDESRCREQVAVRGFPHRNQAIADLSALRQWSQAAEEKHGYAFAMWHNAGGATLRCGPVEEGARHYVCIAIGRPCKASVSLPPAAAEDDRADARGTR